MASLIKIVFTLCNASLSDFIWFYLLWICLIFHFILFRIYYVIDNIQTNIKYLWTESHNQSNFFQFSFPEFIEEHFYSSVWFIRANEFLFSRRSATTIAIILTFSQVEKTPSVTLSNHLKIFDISSYWSNTAYGILFCGYFRYEDREMYNSKRTIKLKSEWNLLFVYREFFLPS